MSTGTLHEFEGFPGPVSRAMTVSPGGHFHNIFSSVLQMEGGKTTRPETWAWMPLMCLCAYMILFSTGLGPGVSIVGSEVAFRLSGMYSQIPPEVDILFCAGVPTAVAKPRFERLCCSQPRRVGSRCNVFFDSHRKAGSVWVVCSVWLFGHCRYVSYLHNGSRNKATAVGVDIGTIFR